MCPLRKQAERKNGSITLLTGNHDMWAFSYLFHEEIEGISPNDALIQMVNTGKGLVAFLPLAGINIPKNFDEMGIENQRKFIREMLKPAEVRGAIRHAIAQSPELQETYGQYQVLHRIDDTLFTHCDPTTNMMEDLLERSEQAGSLDAALLKLNGEYQQSLRHCLAHPEAHPTDNYRKIVNTYTATGNRETFASYTIATELRAKGINAIIHGHTPPGLTTHGDYDAKKFVREFLIISADRSALKDENMRFRRSVATIGKDGVIIGGEDKRLYRTR